MKKLLCFSLFLATLDVYYIYAKGLDVDAVKASELGQYVWKNRVLIGVFSNDSAFEKKQWKIIGEDLSGIKERKLLLLKMLGSKPKRFTEENAFYLIGLDGGIKKKWTKAFALTEIFSIIDAMPMRKREMKKNSNSHPKNRP